MNIEFTAIRLIPSSQKINLFLKITLKTLILRTASSSSQIPKKCNAHISQNLLKKPLGQSKSPVFHDTELKLRIKTGDCNQNMKLAKNSVYEFNYGE